MRFPTRLITLMTPVIALVISSPVQAGPIWQINVDAKNGVSNLATVTWSFNGTSETGLAGTLTTKLPSGQSVDAYCIDLYDTTYVGNGGSNWSAEVLPISPFAGHPTGGNGGAIGYLYSRFASAATTRIDGAALQIALWKVEYDDSANLSTGAFQFADSSNLTSDQHEVFAQATTYLAGFDGTQTSNNATLLKATSHPNGLYQDLVTQGDLISPNSVAVPEPGSIVLMLSGLGAVGLYGHRRARRARLVV